jgi:hypothetical protein
VAVDIDPEERIAVELPAGSISLHHGLTIHGSGPNASDDRRIGVAIRYISSKMTKAGNARDYAMPARGTYDENSFAVYDAPKSNFDADAMKTYDTVRTEQAKVMMAGAKSNSAIY